MTAMLKQIFIASLFGALALLCVPAALASPTTEVEKY